MEHAYSVLRCVVGMLNIAVHYKKSAPVQKGFYSNTNHNYHLDCRGEGGARSHVNYARIAVNSSSLQEGVDVHIIIRRDKRSPPTNTDRIQAYQAL